MWAGGPFGTNEVLAAISLRDVSLGDGLINVKIEDLERRFNVNVHGPAIIAQALLYMGVESFQSSVIMDSLMDWVDPDLMVRTNGVMKKIIWPSPILPSRLTLSKTAPSMTSPNFFSSEASPLRSITASLLRVLQ